MFSLSVASGASATRASSASVLSFSIDFHHAAISWLLSDAHSRASWRGSARRAPAAVERDGLLLASASGTKICRPRAGRWTIEDCPSATARSHDRPGARRSGTDDAAAECQVNFRRHCGPGLRRPRASGGGSPWQRSDRRAHRPRGSWADTTDPNCEIVRMHDARRIPPASAFSIMFSAKHHFGAFARRPECARDGIARDPASRTPECRAGSRCPTWSRSMSRTRASAGRRERARDVSDLCRAARSLPSGSQPPSGSYASPPRSVARAPIRLETSMDSRFGGVLRGRGPTRRTLCYVEEARGRAEPRETAKARRIQPVRCSS
jgi:hypothetical protein